MMIGGTTKIAQITDAAIYGDAAKVNAAVGADRSGITTWNLHLVTTSPMVTTSA